MTRLWHRLMLVLVLGWVVTLILLLIVPQRVEAIGLYWIICGLPWSLLALGGLLQGVLPDNGYWILFLLGLCVAANVAIVRLVENGLRRSRRDSGKPPS
jgi:hypothetical protein